MVLNFLIIISIGLSSNYLGNDTNNFTEQFCWYQNKKVLTSYNDSALSNEIIDVFRIVDGENIVFMYKKRIEFGSEIHNEILVFEIESSRDSFIISNNEILKTNCVYYSLGGAGLDFPDFPDFHISKGFLSGKKLDDNSWELSVNVFTGDKNFQLSSKVAEICILPETTEMY